LALGQSPTSATYTHSGSTPVSALLAFEITSGADSGAFFFPGGATTTGDVLATYQSADAAAGVVLPFVVPTDPAPTVTSVSADTGTSSGGTSVTIAGTNLTTAGVVDFGSASATFTVQSPTLIVATSPATSVTGPVNVTVATLGGTSAMTADDTFTYTAAVATTTTTAASTSPSGSGSSGSSGSTVGMALTGIDLSPLLLGGILLIGIGSVMVASDRRIRRSLRGCDAAIAVSPGEGSAQNS
jgi:hypothetical protein